MRKKGIIAVIVLIVLVALLAFFFTDDWLEGQIESAGTNMVGAKVEIDDLDLNLLQLRAGWNRLQVTDPNNTWRNLIETGQANFDIATEPLLYGRWIIEDFRLEDVRSGTKRETNGKIPQKAVSRSVGPTIFDKTVQRMHDEFEESTGIDFRKIDRTVNVDSIIKILELQTPGNLESFRKDIRQYFDNWQKEISSLSNLKTEAQKMANQIQSIQMDQIKTVDAVTNTINTIQNVTDRKDSIQQSLKAKRETFQEDWNRLQNQVSSVDDWVRADIRRAATKAHLPDFSVENMARVLFGPALVANIEKGVRYFNISQHYAKKLAPTEKVKSPPRFEGQDIRFPDQRNWPKFWLKEMIIYGETGSKPDARGFILSGNVQNLSTNQQMTGKPAVVNLSSKKVNRTSYDITAIFNRLKETPQETFQIDVSRISLNNATLAQSGFLPQKIKQGMMDIKMDLSVVGGSLDGALDFVAQNVSFQFDDDQANNRFMNITRDILQTVNQIDVNLNFNGAPQHLKFKLNSNLDELFANRFQSMVSDQITKGRAEIKKRVTEELEPKKQQVLQFYQQKRNEVEKRIDKLENQIKQYTQVIEKEQKELEKKLEERKKNLLDKLKGKAKDKLKNLLKKEW